MSVRSRLQGWQTVFQIELLYGVLFVGGFAVLVYRFDPLVAAFEAGLVVGYILRVWEKMSIYERAIRQAVSDEAEAQVQAEAEQRVQAEAEQRVGDEVAEEVGERVEAAVAEQVAAEVTDRLEEESSTDRTS